MAEFTKFYIRFLEQLWNNVVHFFATIWDLIARMFYKDWAVNGYFQLFTESSSNWSVLDYVAFIIVLIINIGFVILNNFIRDLCDSKFRFCLSMCCLTGCIMLIGVSLQHSPFNFLM